MLVITFANLKGGSSKTTSTLSVATELAVRGRSVLVVDLDPQATLTASAGRDPASSAASLLSGERGPGAVRDGLLDVEGTGGALRLLPGDRRLLRLERTAPVRLSERLLSLVDLVEGEFDAVVVDTPPQASALVTAALASSDHVLVPVASGRGALDGLGDVVELTERMGTPPVSGAFVTRVNSSSIHDRELAAHVAGVVDGGLETYVRETVRVREAEMARVPVPLYAPDSTAASDYAALVDELEGLFWPPPVGQK